MNKVLALIKKLFFIFKEDLKNFGFHWKPFIIVCIFVLAILIPRYHESFFFPFLRRNNLTELATFLSKYYLNFSFIVQIIIPPLLLLAMKENLTFSGWGLGNIKTGIKISLIFMIIYIPCFLILYFDPESQRYYNVSINKIKTWKDFAIDEMLPTFFAMLKTEYLYRGLLLLGLRRYFGDFNANLTQNITYTILHSGKPELEALGSFPVGLALGYLALKTNSFWYGLFLHWFIAILFTAVSLIAN